MKDKIFEVDKYDLNMCYISLLNKKTRICINEKFVHIASREVCAVDECVFFKQNFILITEDKKEMIIQEINEPFLKEILKFIINNKVIDCKIVNK
jgi:hypothetical protein